MDTTTTTTRTWKRSFMTAEHESRKMKRGMQAEIHEIEMENYDHKQEIETLKAHLSRNQRTIQSQHRVIQRLQKTLKDNAIPEPIDAHVGSLKTCRASDDELCPLSLHPINASPLPYDKKYPEILIEPHKPNNKCAELMCGHRYNVLWLLFYFVGRSTFRCPICRYGHEEFKFEAEQLPGELIDRVKQAMKMK
jgi:hypothetical protein